MSMSQSRDDQLEKELATTSRRCSTGVDSHLRELRPPRPCGREDRAVAAGDAGLLADGVDVAADLELFQRAIGSGDGHESTRLEPTSPSGFNRATDHESVGGAGVQHAEAGPLPEQQLSSLARPIATMVASAEISK